MLFRSRENRSLLISALEILDETERNIIILHAACGLKHREISSSLGMNISTVLSKYHRGLKKLKNHLSSLEEYNEYK